MRFPAVAAASSCFLLLGACKPAKPPALQIVQDGLVKVDSSYQVVGEIINPTETAATDVTIRYEVWAKLKGSPRAGSVVRESGGLAVAKIKYIAPGQTVSFVAVGRDRIPVMTKESGLVPDPLKAEITATWAE